MLKECEITNKVSERWWEALISDHTIHLQIGSTCCALKCKDEDTYLRLKQLYHGFLMERPADITIELKTTNRLSLEKLTDTVKKTKFFHGKGGHFKSNSSIVSGEYNLAQRYITITGEKKLVNPDLTINHLNRLISLAYYSACKVNFGDIPPEMLVHACGIIRHGKSMLFTGPSEAGKTTVASLCGQRDGVVINDEMLLVSRPGQPGNMVKVSNAPIIGAFSSKPGLTAPLRCVFVLKKGSQTVLRPIEKTKAYLTFMRQVITPAYIGQTDKRALLALIAGFSAEITRTIPVYELEFTLNGESLWQAVSEVEKTMDKEYSCR